MLNVRVTLGYFYGRVRVRIRGTVKVRIRVDLGFSLIQSFPVPNHYPVAAPG